MNLNAVNKLATYAFRFFDTRKQQKPIIETLTQKPDIPVSDREKYFPRVSPESMGIPSKTIADYIGKIASDKTLNMHNIMILRGGKVIFECGFGAQDADIPRMTFSACKSITSIAVGMLFDDGLLRPDETVAQIFGDRVNIIDKIRMDNITVEDLLTMRSAVAFNEAESFTSVNWTKSFFASAVQGKTGETFAYNSLNTYMLSAIVYKKTGKHLSEYLAERLFEPLGITDYAWEKCPMGIEKGGWGLYMRPEDMAKIGTLVMNYGVWDGKRLISEEYIREATRAHVQTPKSTGNFNYGYQIWVGKDTDTFLFNGMLGQNVLGFRKNGIIIVSNAGNGEIFQQSNFYSLTLSTFDNLFGAPLPEHLFYRAELNKLKRELVFGSGKTRLTGKSQVYAKLSGFFAYEYKPYDETAQSFGLMPMILQVTQSNYTRGIKGICFDLDRARNAVTVRFEENDETYVFSAGLLKGEKTELSFRGEKFTVCAYARFAYNEDMEPVLIIRIDFTETPCSRVFKFYFDGGDMLCRAEEEPGAEFIVKSAGDMLEELLDGTVIARIADKLDMGYVEYKMEQVFSRKLKFKGEVRTISE